MVSWRRAFIGALVYVAYSIIWIIVGVVILIGGILVGRITYGPFGIPQVNLFGIIIVIIGCFIIALGAIATLLKVSAE
ncbi:MAG: hypothetical protein QW575_02340, partial [Thermoproteota archaeon]